MRAGMAKDVKLADAGWYIGALLAVSLCFDGYRRAENLQAAIENRWMKLIGVEIAIRNLQFA